MKWNDVEKRSEDQEPTEVDFAVVKVEGGDWWGGLEEDHEQIGHWECFLHHRKDDDVVKKLYDLSGAQLKKLPAS